MYMIEWQIWSHATSSIREREITGSIWEKHGYSRFNKAKISESIVDHTKSYSKKPKPLGPYYAYNDTYLEIRGGMMEERRGPLSLLSLAFLFFGCFSAHLAYVLLLDGPIFATIFVFLGSLVFLGSFALAYKIVRLEIFTHRHLRVRFNRITRQVYIQRPKYCGGVAVYRWEDTQPSISAKSKVLPVMGSRNLLVWEPINTGLPYIDYMAIGKQATTGQDIKDEWEFIRRYMENGPEGLPRPAITSLLPLPWHGVSVQLESMRGFFWPLHGFSILMLPLAGLAVTLMSLLYFLSELFCWQPRWPKVIREAGKQGKQIPKLTALDDFPADMQEKLLLNREELEYVDDTAPVAVKKSTRRWYRKKKNILKDKG